MNLVLDNEYQQTLTALKERVRSAQFKAVRSVNVELIKLYWDIGNTVIEKQQHHVWGSKFLEQVSKDLSNAFPDMTGFSRSNVAYMRKFSSEYPSFETVQPLAGQLEWTKIILLLDKISKRSIRDWYAAKTIENNWSRRVLSFQISQDLYSRQGTETKKITNFSSVLPAPQSERAQEVLKDPFKFEFLALGDKPKERDIEEGLISHIRDFLLELGTGFAFIGNQYHLEVGGDDFYIDCLFYNYQMRCFVILEIKTGKFKPEYAGQLNFYQTVIDREVKHKDDNPTIGILLCESKNEIVAQYSVDGMTKPMGISQYELSKMLTKKLKRLVSSQKDLKNKTEKDYIKHAVTRRLT